MAELKPLRLKAQSALITRKLASDEPIARVLVDHQIPHLDQIYEYTVPQEFSAEAQIGALVEIEFGHSLTQGIILSRSANSESAGKLKQIKKILSQKPYILVQQLSLIPAASAFYGASEWDFIRSTVPPFSKQGEKQQVKANDLKSESKKSTDLPQSLKSILSSTALLRCVIELPISNPYWMVAAKVGLERQKFGSVLFLLPNERELALFEKCLADLGVMSIVIRSTDPKSVRYRKYMEGRSATSGFILGTRSSVFLPLAEGASIILVDDGDESHYERKAPSWNTRELVALRESKSSVLYISPSISTELADRVDRGELALYRFPRPTSPAFTSEGASGESGYHSIIKAGLTAGSVLISVLGTGYVTSFSCQKCRNVALCSCGGKLFIPNRGTNPRCATCTVEHIEWKCLWCQESKPRIVRSGVHRHAEEFGRSFPRYSVITSSGLNPVLELPEGIHLVLSTPGVEPRGSYAAQIFLDLEMQLLRTTLRAKEELRLHIMRNLTTLKPGGAVYFSLPPSDPFLQSILRGNPLLAAEREIEERDSASLPPHFLAILIHGENIDALIKVLSEVSNVEIIGPFLRNKKKSLLIKAPVADRSKLVQLLSQINRVQSMRKEPLLTYQINPYSLN